MGASSLICPDTADLREFAAEQELLDCALAKLTARRLSRLSKETRAQLTMLLEIAIDDMETA